MNSLANLNLEQMKVFSLVILPTRKHISYNKRLGRIVDNIDVVVNEKGYIPRQVIMKISKRMKTTHKIRLMMKKRPMKKKPMRSERNK